MASVLVIALDPDIESLVNELVVFAGHRSFCDNTLGAAGECIRRLRPDISVLDDALPPTVLDHCLDASDEVGASAVLISSTETNEELREQARTHGCSYFLLPGGPRLLATVLESALSKKRSESSVPLASYCENGTSPVHPALCAALASVARARALTIRATAVLLENRQLRDDSAAALVAARRSRNGLRAAVSDYAAHLKSEAVPADQMVDMLSLALADCATAVGAKEALTLVASDSLRWAVEAYNTP